MGARSIIGQSFSKQTAKKGALAPAKEHALPVATPEDQDILVRVMALNKCLVANRSQLSSKTFVRCMNVSLEGLLAPPFREINFVIRLDRQGTLAP